MNSLSRWENKWNPFKEMEDLQQRFSTLFDRWPVWRTQEGEEAITAREWSPAVDITEDDKEYLITAELPEVKKEDVKITVENGTLTLSGQRQLEKEEKGRRYHRVERSYGSFVRSFGVPDDADPSKVSAEFKEGLLKVHLAKSPEARPRSIEVKVS